MEIEPKFMLSPYSSSHPLTIEYMTKLADKEVKEDIKNIKKAIVDEEKRIKTLGIIQVLLCRHVGMPQEEVDMFKDALENGTDVSSLL